MLGIPLYYHEIKIVVHPVFFGHFTANPISSARNTCILLKVKTPFLKQIHNQMLHDYRYCNTPNYYFYSDNPISNYDELFTFISSCKRHLNTVARI